MKLSELSPASGSNRPAYRKGRGGAKAGGGQGGQKKDKPAR